MKFSHSIVKVALASVLFVGCKDAASQPTEDTTAAKTEAKKEIAEANKPATATVHIEGMTCSIGCAKAIEENLSDLKGVQKATVDFDKKEATINFDLDVLKPEDLVKTIEASADGKSYKASGLKVGNKV